MDQAIDWLDKNADKTVEEIDAETSETATADDPDAGPALKPGEVAQSLVCNDCGRHLRSHAQAEFHASKTGHINFSESTESIKPLTEEEKKAKLEELRQKAAAKRSGTQDVDKAEQKRNEVCSCDVSFLRQKGWVHTILARPLSLLGTWSCPCPNPLKVSLDIMNACVLWKKCTMLALETIATSCLTVT